MPVSRPSGADPAQISAAREKLAELAAYPSKELRATPAGTSVQEGWVKREGSWGGRLIRSIQITFAPDSVTQDERDHIVAGKEKALKQMKTVFGDEVGEKVFRAVVGGPASDGSWDISEQLRPLTGRHVEKMLRAAETATAGLYDITRMQQISPKGMAGLFSKGVCNAATTDWFRRIEDGLPTWKHVRGEGDAGQGGPVTTRESIDWSAMRQRLQHIQDKGPEGDPLFKGRVYLRGEPIDQRIIAGTVDSRRQAADESAANVLRDAEQKFAADPHLQNAFYQIDIPLKGRMFGKIGHTIGVHVARPEKGGPAEVHVFDANAREAQVPAREFGLWLGSHLESRYGQRLAGNFIASAVERKTPERSKDAEHRNVASQQGAHAAPEGEEWVAV